MLWTARLRASHWFWMPKSTFLLASCLQNGVTCSLLWRLINTCGMLVFHNAECLELSIKKWAISLFRGSLEWLAVNTARDFTVARQMKYSCIAACCSNSSHGLSLNKQPRNEKLYWAADWNCVGKMFLKVSALIQCESCSSESGLNLYVPSVFWLLCGQETISGFRVRFCCLFLVAAWKTDDQGMRAELFTNLDL